MTAQELYETTIKRLPPADRLRLATLILNGLLPETRENYSEEWTEEDMRETTLHSFNRAAESFGETNG
jgi:protoheme ferro-lyase